MMLSTSGLPLLLLLGLAVWFWQNTLAARELAIRTAREICRTQNIQLLDGTVVIQGIRIQRSRRNIAELRRTFQFSYSEDSVNRATGFVIVAGKRIEQSGL